MRFNISVDRVGWLYNLNYKKLIIVAFLLRFIFAATYDCFVNVTGKDLLVPDSKFYSIRGLYISFLLNGYDKDHFIKNMLPGDAMSRSIFVNTVEWAKGRLPNCRDDTNLFIYCIGIIYFLFGYFPLGVRIVNVVLGIGSVYLLFKIGRRHFGVLAANLFLLIALFLPTQLIYSITISRDVIRMFLVCLILWVIYG